MALPLIVLGRAFESLQAGRQQVAEETVQVGKALRAHAVQAPSSITPFAHQTGFPQHLQVLRDRRLGHGEM
jgi:hypothetical protein